MTLKELILAVKDDKLPKEELEKYRDQISNLFAQMQFELADVEKSKAVFFYDMKKIAPNDTDVSIKRNWQSTQRGLREIELKRYTLATKEILSSLKSRLFSLY